MVALCAPEQAGRSPDAMITIGGRGGVPIDIETQGPPPLTADIDRRPPTPTVILSPAACPRARAHRARFACPSGQAPPLRADEHRGAYGDAATVRGRKRGGGPRVGARNTPRMEDSRSN